MARYFYSDSIESFCSTKTEAILGTIVSNAQNALDTQTVSWEKQILILKTALDGINGHICFEYTIPRIGKRVDCIILYSDAIYVLEFKIGAKSYDKYAIDQVESYALDLSYFHEKSHNTKIIPILVADNAKYNKTAIELGHDNIAKPLLTNGTNFFEIFNSQTDGEIINAQEWINSIYRPTPTIIEAAQALYQNHSVEDITRTGADSINLTATTDEISKIIEFSKHNNKKSICFITGVPGAGKTLAGLNFANTRHNPEINEHAVFLSGNGPLVNVLREALIRDKISIDKANGTKTTKEQIAASVNAFIQNIHHFRDDNIGTTTPTLEHVVIFDEAQRAWDINKTTAFMKKKGHANFDKSEPEFLIGVMDRHEDWATIICLVGEGQEINTGEAGISEWLFSIKNHFSDWLVFCDNSLIERVNNTEILSQNQNNVNLKSDLHLAVSIRSFRSEKVSEFIGKILEANRDLSELSEAINQLYPIKITRDFTVAKNWLKSNARGLERYGIVASSGGVRLKAEGVFVKNKIDPCDWFLNYKDDVRSSYYLEDVATEFDVQGLELDWVCVAWDADLRFTNGKWTYKKFRGTKWQDIKSESGIKYLINSYRVMLTRARQGMVIYIPYGDNDDETRKPALYDGTFNYLKSLGLKELKLS
jgi:DUF2075 family protein